MTKCHVIFLNNFSGEKMNNNDHKELEIIKEVIERVQDPISVFEHALKKILDASEEELLVILGKYIEKYVIKESVTSDGTTGPEWLRRITAKGHKITLWASNILTSKDFKPTNGVTTDLAIILDSFFKNIKRNVKNIRAEGDKREYCAPNVEVACLLLDKYSDVELKVIGVDRIVVMHDSINDQDGHPSLLYVAGDFLGTFYDTTDGIFISNSGFAFEIRKHSDNPMLDS